MYSDITEVFLSSIRALRFYVNSVEDNIEYPITTEEGISDEALTALLMRTVIQGRKNNLTLTKDIEYPKDMPEEAKVFLYGIIEKIDKLITEKSIDGKTKYEFKYVPKKIKKEYEKFDVLEKQEEILYSGSLMLLVTYFENLVAGVLKKDFIKHPKRVSLDEKSVSYKLLVEIGDIEEVKNILIDQEITNKMYGSFEDWKCFFQRNMKLKLISWDIECKHLQEIIARRNLFVHNNGIINSIYLKLNDDVDASAIGETIGISRQYIDESIDVIEYLGIALVLEAWIKEYADNEEEMKNITNIIYEEYLENEKWEMAKHFYEICLNNPKIKASDKMLCLINSWQCYKWLGEYDKIRDDIEKIDLSAYKPMYVLGILALKDEYKEFFEYYDEQTDIGEAELNEWPLFRELRNSEEFQKRFPEIVDEEETTEEATN